MATTKTKFEGWSFKDDVRNESDSGRYRRATDNLILTRESDGLEVKKGDTLLVTDGANAPAVVLVTNARVGTDDYIVLTSIYLMRLSEVENSPEDSVEQELFVTCALDKISVANIIEKAIVLNYEDFQKVVIDSSNVDVTFMCRRGYDTYYHSYSSDLDFNAVRDGLKKDTRAQTEFLRSFIVKSLYKPKAPVVKQEKHEPSPKPAKVSPKQTTKPEEKPIVKPVRKSTRVKLPSKRQKSNGAKVPIQSEQENSDENNEEEEEEEEEEDDDDDVYVSHIPIESYDLNNSDDLNDSEVEVKGLDIDDDSDSSSDSLPLFSSDEDEFQPRMKYNLDGEGRIASRIPARRIVKGPRSLITNAPQIEEKDEDVDSHEVINRLPCREDQFTEIYYTLESAIEIASGTALYISGPPGTGKTVTVREVVKQLYKQSKFGNVPKFDYLEINGLKILSPQSAYETLWNKVANRRVPSSGISTKLEEYFKKGETKVPLIILLDELDQIASTNQSILYNFFNWPTYEKSKLILLAVANTMDLPERLLTNKTSSRLGLARIPFPGYTHEDLIKIIHSKLATLERENIVIKKDSIEYASRRVASVSGDARRALKIVKRAVELAKESQPGTEEVLVLPQHINRAISETTSSPVAKYILHLTFVGKLILVGLLSRIRKSGLAENTLGDIIDEIKQIVTLNSAKDSSQFIVEGENILDILYHDFVIRPKGFGFVLGELIEAGLVLQQNLKTERNSIVKLNIPVEDITSVFKKESSLRFFASLVEQMNE